MKIQTILINVLIAVSLISCGKEGLSDAEIPIPSRNAQLNITVEYCQSGVCNPIRGKIVNIYEYEDEAMGFNEGLRLLATDTSGIARFGYVELPKVYVKVIHDGDLEIVEVNLPINTTSHELIQFPL